MYQSLSVFQLTKGTPLTGLSVHTESYQPSSIIRSLSLLRGRGLQNLQSQTLLTLKGRVINPTSTLRRSYLYLRRSSPYLKHFATKLWRFTPYPLWRTCKVKVEPEWAIAGQLWSWPSDRREQAEASRKRMSLGPSLGAPRWLRRMPAILKEDLRPASRAKAPW